MPRRSERLRKPVVRYKPSEIPEEKELGDDDWASDVETDCPSEDDPADSEMESFVASDGSCESIGDSESSEIEETLETDSDDDGYDSYSYADESDDDDDDEEETEII